MSVTCMRDIVMKTATIVAKTHLSSLYLEVSLSGLRGMSGGTDISGLVGVVVEQVTGGGYGVIVSVI